MDMTARRALAWSFAERYASFALALVGGLIVARLITPRDLGIYSVCAAFTAVAGILRDFGVSEYLIQERELTRDKLRAACSVAILVAWPLAAALYFGRLPLADYFAEPGVARVLAVLALHFVLLPLTSPAFALLNREMAFHRIFALQLACSVVTMATSLTLAWRGFGYMALAWGAVSGVVAQTLILLVTRPRDSLLLPGFRQARTVLRFGSMYVVSRGVETLARHAHEPVIAKGFDFTSAGLFARAWGLVEMFNTYVSDAVVRVATPAFAAEHRADRSLGPSFARATAIFVAVSWPFFGFVALCSEEIIRVLFGAQWVAAAPLATILALASLPAGLHELVPQMLSATGHVARRLRIALLVGGLHIVLVLGAATISLPAVAAVSVLSACAMVALGIAQLRQALGITAMAYLRPCWGSAAVAGVSFAGQWAGWAAARAGGAPALLVLACAAALGTMGWLATARGLNHPAFSELQGMARARRRRLTMSDPNLGGPTR